MSVITIAISKTWMHLTIYICLLVFQPGVFAQTATYQSEQPVRTIASQQGVSGSQHVLQNSQQVVTAQQTQTAKSNTAKNFTGTWRLNSNVNLTNQRLKAIENVVASMGRFKQGRARDMLKKMTAPPRELKITDSGSQIKLTRAGREMTVPTNGQAVTANGDKGRVTLQAGRRDGKLIVVAKTANATKTTVYGLLADGQTLTQQVQIQNNKLPTPIQFANSFTK